MVSSYKICNGCFYDENSRNPFIKFPEIICFNAYGNYTYMYSLHREKILLFKQLCDIETELELQVDYFYRTHKSWHLSYQHVVLIMPSDHDYSGRYIELVNKDIIAKCSRYAYPDFRIKLLDYRLKNGYPDKNYPTV